MSDSLRESGERAGPDRASTDPDRGPDGYGGTFRPQLAITDVSIWQLVERFFDARRDFQPIYDSYETQVLRYAEERGIDRRLLRLEADEIADLVDLRRLEALRNGPLEDLKLISHELFRASASTDKFDRYVSELYHEASILKEEHYRVARFARSYDKSTEERSYEDALDEVHEQFPRKVHAIHDLFERAKRRLEELLPNYGSDKVFVRSLYLFGEELLSDAYPEGLEGYYWILYPGGPAEGYEAAGSSFRKGGFREHATRSFEKAVDFVERDQGFEPSEEAVAAAERSLKHLAELKAAAAEKKTKKKLTTERPATPGRDDAGGSGSAAAS